MILPIEAKYINKVVEIHYNSIEFKNLLLPKLGPKIMTLYYQYALQSDENLGFVYMDGQKIQGFIFGTVNKSNFYRQIFLRSKFKISCFITLRLIRKPFLLSSLIRYTIQKILLPKEEQNLYNAELITIAVNQEIRGKKIGKKLVQTLNKKFKDYGISKYQVIVEEENKAAIRFYKKLGFQYIKNFVEFGRKCVLYDLEIRH